MTGLFADDSNFDPEDEGPSETDLAQFGESATRCQECGTMLYADADVCTECGAFQVRSALPTEASTRAFWSPGMVMLVTAIVLAAFTLVFVL